MTRPDPRPALASAVFADDEPVVARAGRATGPRFGDTDVWDFNPVIPRPAKTTPGAWKLVFSGPLAEPVWNLAARELCMIELNPRHPRLIAAGLSLAPAPASVSTLIARLCHLRGVARRADRLGLPHQPSRWSARDLERLLADLPHASSDGKTTSPALGPSSMISYLSTLRLLYRYRTVLPDSGLAIDPCQGRSANQVVGRVHRLPLSTPPITPEIWFPLLRAAWAYVHVFSADIFAGHERQRTLLAQASPSVRGAAERLDRWLADPTHRIPVHRDTPTGPVTPNWAALGLLLGIEPPRARNFFLPRGRARVRRDARGVVLAALAAGHPTAHSLTPLVEVSRPDGTTGPWHAGLYADSLHRERSRLRNACYVIVAALSMMRDSELLEIARESRIDYYGYPALAARKTKNEPGRPAAAWWITAPVVEALTVAGKLSPDPQRVFTALRSDEPSQRHDSGPGIVSFIAHVNATVAWTGLDPIPEGPVRPHMFRRTMAMLTDQFPGSEIALGLQLKHVAARALANQATRGYAASDESWAGYLDTAMAATRFRRLEDLYRAHQAGESIGYGPAAERVAQTFDRVAATAAARSGDATVERALLQREQISLRFGTLNHCALDDAHPQGALCLERATVPPGHTGPLPDRCRPDRCANSIIGPEHLPVWQAEKASLLTLLETPRMPAARAAMLQSELSSVEAVLARTGQDTA